jgi:hypothetical protein
MANPLDRTWYNTLVDDDGSGTTGTVWNKTQVDGLMDAVDASLATVVDKSGTPGATQLARFLDADTVAGSPLSVDVAQGGLLATGPYPYVDLTDTTAPIAQQQYRIVNTGQVLHVQAMGTPAFSVITVARTGMSIQGTLTLLDGKLRFPTTPIPSADPYTLDDYREGLCTLYWGGTGGYSGQTYTIQSASYQKTGNRVHLSGRVLLATLGTISGNLMLRGLPVAGSAAVYNPGGLKWTGGAALTLPVSHLTGIVTPGATDVPITYLPAGGASGLIPLPASALQAGTDFSFDLDYETA